ncbi:MAG: hypothetical protein N2450_03160 [bacterium]|nr:hypothetical protein [bacterium]
MKLYKLMLGFIPILVGIAILLSGMSKPKSVSSTINQTQAQNDIQNNACRLRLDDVYAWIDRMPRTQPKAPTIRIKMTFTAFGAGIIVTPIVSFVSEEKCLPILNSELKEIQNRTLNKNDSVNFELMYEIVSVTNKKITLCWIEPKSKDTLFVPIERIETVY